MSPSLDQSITEFRIGEDHLPQLLTIALTAKRLTRPPKQYLKKANWTKYKQHITDNLGEHTSTTIQETDERATLLTRLITTAAQISIPKYTGPRRFQLPRRV